MVKFNNKVYSHSDLLTDEALRKNTRDVVLNRKLFAVQIQRINQ